MREFFGLDMGVLASVLATLLTVALLIVAFFGIRNRILVKLALRNIPRRPAQTVLIVIGLMLSTTIISASLAIGDTVAGSIRGTVLDGLGNTDLRVRSPVDAGDFGNIFGGGSSNVASDIYIDEETVNSVVSTARADTRIDGVLPLIREILPVLNDRTQLTDARMVVVGLDPGATDGFGDITATTGQTISVSSLGGNEVLLNQTAAEEIDAQAGDPLVIATPTGRHMFIIMAVVRDGGLAANDNRLVLSLPEMQRIMARPGQVNRIDISLEGGRETPAGLSREVAEDLRIAFTDAGAAGQLFDVLNDPETIAAIQARIDQNPGNIISASAKEDLVELVGLLESGDRSSERFRLLVVKTQVQGHIAAAMESAGQFQQLQQAAVLLFQVELLGVDELKQDLLDVAETIGSFFVTFFTIFGSFSIIVGLLLIFLVFVMLAAERSNEMGIARAVGAKRRHLIQMFTFEGVAYSIGAAIVGTIIGLAASRLLVALLATALGTGADGQNGFEFQFTLTATSVIAGFSLGLLLTLVTVAFSAYRVSKLNIVVAIRGLPAEFEPSEILPLKRRLQNLGIALISPVWQLYRITTVRNPNGSKLREFFMFLLYLTIFPWALRAIIVSWRVVSPYFRTGIPQIVIGLLGAVSGVNASNAFLFTTFTSLFLVGIGQVVRWLAYRNGMRREIADRIGFTLMGALVLIFWVLPFDALEWLTGELGGGIEMFIVSGVWMVASAVWVVMYNADLIANAMQATFGRFQRLRPILKPAIAYPTAARFRTGLTVAMFALVIFTLMVISILNNLGSNIIDTPYKATGGFDVRAETTPDLPVTDIQSEIAGAPNLDLSDFEVIASSADVPAEARQPGAEEIRFLSVPVRGVDETYLRNVQFEISHFDPAYLPAGIDTGDRQAVARAIWDRLAEEPSLAVVSNALLEIPAGGGEFGFGGGGFRVEGIAQDDDEQIESFGVSIRRPRGEGETVGRTVIAAVDPLAGIYESADGTGTAVIITSSEIFDQISDTPVPYTTFRIMLAEGVDPGRTAAAMETAFLDNGLLATDTVQEIRDGIAQSNAFNRLFQAFMGLGLVVGVASLGVLSFRAVVERRLSIGMMRAIGYKAHMVQVQFLIESVFVTVLGTAIGLALGAIISWNIVNDIGDSVEGLEFAVPWATVSVIVVIAVVAALITTFIPARQASRIYPSEALRYE